MRLLLLALVVATISPPAFAVARFIDANSSANAQYGGRLSVLAFVPGFRNEPFNGTADRGACLNGTPWSGDSVAFAPGSIPDVRLAIGGNDSCYMSIGRNEIPAGLVVAEALDASARRPTYIGFQWGSVDEYNQISFRDSVGVPMEIFDQSGQSLGRVLDGAEAAILAGRALYRDVFLNFSFSGELPFYVAFVSAGNNAIEVDNFSWGAFQAPFTPAATDARAQPLAVPAPAALSIAASGLAGIAARSRLTGTARTAGR